MKLRDLKNTKENNLIGRKIGGKAITDKWLNDFICSGYKLTSLEGAPSHVGGTFNCMHNSLTSLKGAPSRVDSSFYCTDNKFLTSLEGAPEEIGASFSCSKCDLSSLKGAPFRVGDNFYCTNNKLASLEGAPTYVGGNFICHNNKLTSLEGIHKIIKEVDGEFYCEENSITSHVLGLLKIKKLIKVHLDNKKLEKIINKYLPEGNIFDCQEELIEAGYEEYAQL